MLVAVKAVKYARGWCCSYIVYMVVCYSTSGELHCHFTGILNGFLTNIQHRGVLGAFVRSAARF